MDEYDVPICVANCGDELVGPSCAKIIAVCPSLHLMHSQCVNRMYESNDNPCCPICRDDTLSLLKDMIIKNPLVPDDDDDDDDDSLFDESLTVPACDPVPTDTGPTTSITYNINYAQGGCFVVRQ